MRDPNRIKLFTDKLCTYWKKYIPDQRFGQFMSNFLGYAYTETKRDIFFIEEKEMESLLDKYFEQMDPVLTEDDAGIFTDG